MPTRLSSLLCVLLLALVLPVAACSPRPRTAQPVTIDVRLVDGRVEPNAQVVEVGYGAEVTLRVTADHADTVHVHGFEVELAVQPGATATTTFTASRTGRYEVESHSPVRNIGFLDVR